MIIRKGQRYEYVDNISLGTDPLIKEGDIITIIKKQDDFVKANFKGKEVKFHYTYIKKEAFNKL